MVRTIRWFIAAACIVCGSTSLAAQPDYSPAARPFVYPQWQDVQSLPRRFRNHCSFDVTHAIYYCSDHCGLDYQVYYCSRRSFGCCHVAHGYCDENGLVRCRP